MPIPGRIACGAPPPPVKIRRAGVAYWTPADLGWDPVSLTPLDQSQSPILLVAGLNSFMLQIEFLAFTPGFSVLHIQIDFYDPVTEAFVATADLFSIAGGMENTVTWGAFGTGVGFATSFSTGYVWWLIRLTLFNQGTEADSYRIHLLGGTR